MTTAAILTFKLEDLRTQQVDEDWVLEELVYITIEGVRYFVTDYNPDTDEYRAISQKVML